MHADNNEEGNDDNDGHPMKISGRQLCILRDPTVMDQTLAHNYVHHNHQYDNQEHDHQHHNLQHHDHSAVINSDLASWGI